MSCPFVRSGREGSVVVINPDAEHALAAGAQSGNLLIPRASLTFPVKQKQPIYLRFSTIPAGRCPGTNCPQCMPTHLWRFAGSRPHTASATV